VRTAGLCVVQTWCSSTEGPFEIELGAAPDARSRLYFITRDRAVYSEALQIEGLDIRIEAEWHREDGARVLDALHPVPKEEEQ
jgi:hypothetical protein